jgi:hypothetical protein
MQEYQNIKQQWHWQQDHWNHKAYIQHSNRTGYLVVSPSQSATQCVSSSLFAAVAAVAAAAASFVVPLEIPLHYPVLAYVALSFHDTACICQKTHEHHYCLLDVMPCSLIDQYKHFTETCYLHLSRKIGSLYPSTRLHMGQCECTPWVSKPWTAKLYFAAHGHICKPYIYHTNYTII